ncbi:hypothetical protein MMC22_008545 [Lobaria immixta]|nr:hypothetical protein [Lobaria immixta]
MSLLKTFPVAGSKRPAPSDNTSAADSASNQAVGVSPHEDEDEDEDPMDISGDDGVVADGEYCRVTKRMKTRATMGHDNGLREISVASTNKPPIDTSLPTTGDTETNPNQSNQSVAEDIEDQAKEVSPKGNKAGLLFSQISTAQLPDGVEHLHANYSFSPIEIGPNSKFDQTVQAVVRLVGRFSLADIHMKPTIVVLSSMAKHAGRLIAIVEGAKSQIAADEDKWFQYNEMHGVIVPMKTRNEKRTGGGKTLREWDEEQKAKAKAKETVAAAEAVRSGEGDAMDVDDDVFQTVVRRKSEDLQAVPDSENDKIRHTPVITVFIARLRVPELAKLYG